MTYQSRPQQPPAADVDAAGQRNLINVGEDEQGPWAGWGIGSYADPDEERNSETYAWRDELIEPGRHHQLFVDDGALASAVGITRSLHPPVKIGPVMKSPIAGFEVRSRNAPQWNPDKQLWEWWVMARRQNEGDGEGADGGGSAADRKGVPRHQAVLEKGQASGGGPVVFAHPDAVRQKDYHGNDAPVSNLTLYATSTTGEIWDFPALGLFEWEGSTENSIAVDPTGPQLYHVIRDESAPAEQRYKGLFGVANRAPAVSADGFAWTLLDVPPVPSRDESQFSYDPYKKRWLACVKQPTEFGRSVFLCQSPAHDFGSFSAPELMIKADDTDWANARSRVKNLCEDPAFLTPPIVDDEDYFAEIYNMAVLPYAGMYLGFPTVFNPIGAIPPPATNFTRINQVEMAVSRDLAQWERVADRTIVLGVEPYDGKNYDTGQLMPAGAPVVRPDGEIWFYYAAHRFNLSASDYRKFDGARELFRLGVQPADFADQAALCLAKLRPDGFVSLDAEMQGTVVTKPFVWPKGQRLWLNCDASWGEIYAEVVDVETAVRPLLGFGRAAGGPVRGDHPHGIALSWDGIAPADYGWEQPVRLKLYAHQARLYSFWLE